MKKIAVLIVLVLFTNTLIADEKCVFSSNNLTLQLSSLPEAKLVFSQDFVFPFMQGSSPLTEGNNIKFNTSADISPVSLNGLFNAVLTPIAFIELSAGGRIGTGWPISLFGIDLYGIGLNLEDGYKGSAFDALIWKAQLGGTFQFDFGAIFPGDWNHVVFLTYHEINIHGNTGAKKGEAWYFEADEGENMNGLNYYGNIVLGYQMPLMLNMVAFMAEMEKYLYDTPNRKLWGDDLIRWYLSGILNFGITDQLSITAICQFRSQRNFIKGTENLHYQSRILDPSKNKQRIDFYRIAGIITYKF